MTPRAWRQARGWIELRADGVVEIRPEPVDVEVRRVGRVSVLVPAEPVAALTTAEVNRLLREIRDER